MGTFTGTTGDDTLSGGPGPDTLIGLTGNDAYIVNDPGDIVVENPGEGFDVVYASVSYTLGAGQEIEGLVPLDFNSTSPLVLTGNEFVNYILGNAGANTLNGGGGADTLEAKGGDDTLNGGSGADTMIGGLGNDIYIIDNAGDVTIEAVGQGYDVAYASVSYTLLAGQEIEGLVALDFNSTVALNFTGNELANYLIGNAGDNQLSGGQGADLMEGRLGNDIYIIDNSGDAVIEAVGQGYDVAYTSVSYTLATGWSVEGLVALDFNSTAVLNLTGNELDNYLIANAGANLLLGGAGADTLEGRAGDDTLDGGTGADFLFGGQGNDIYYIDNAGDQITEVAGQGYDVAYVTTSYTLAAGQEVEGLSTLDWGGTTAINLTGNAIANYMIGNAGANTLDGGAGADAMYGKGGNDIYIVDNAFDGAFENAGEGTDTVRTSVSYTLGANIENLEAAAGTAALNLTGNADANTITGNAGANLIDGGIGADTMTGGLGDDIYLVDNGADVVVELGSEGTDTVRASVSYTIGGNIEILEAATGTAAINLTGSGQINTIRGNDGANVIDGGLGSDVLTGGLGADSFAFTTQLGAPNVDSITDFVAGTDKILLGGAVGQPFVALATGSLRAGTLVIGTAAVDADDYLIYNSATGALLYDADGVGGAAAVQFATLSTGLSLTVADFLVSGVANTAPAITSGATASIAENTAAVTIVYQTAASDADGDRITYSLSGTDAALLNIDANGAVRLNNAADFETKNSYVFNVVASDSGVATTRAVTLTITDVVEAGTPIINETGAANDTLATAQSIDPGTFVIAGNPNLYNQAYPSASILGTISTPGDLNNVSSDVDFYSITLQAGQQLILDVDGTNGLDSFLSLYGPNMVLIGDNDDQVEFDPGSNHVIAHNWDSQIIFRAATAGTYYFSIKSFADADTNQPTSKGAYTLNVSVNSVPATAAQIMAEDVQALVSGASWDHAGPAFNLTYGFPTSASFYPQSFAEVTPASDFEAFSATQQAATRSLLQLVANVTQLTFSENTTQGDYTVAGTAANANLRYAESTEVDGAAYAYYPTNGGPVSLGGSAWFNHDDFNTPQRGNYAWMGILHETGHALGLKHGHEFPLAISAGHDSLEYSVMTYRSYPGQSLAGGGGYTNETWGYAQTLMMLDIAALQKIYGSANYNFNSGASTYSWSATTGEMSINGVGQGAPGNGDGITLASENRIFMTIWDGGGTDTYDLSNYTTNMSIDLRPGEWSTLSSAQLANLGSGGHLARGNVANALMFQDNPGSLIENAIGGSGNDGFVANQAANHFTGNGGNDNFLWLSLNDVGVGNLADTIMDFTSGSERIILQDIDANPNTSNDDPFTFIGTNAFTAAGQVRYEVTGGSAHIFGDVNGDHIADFEIIVNNVTTLSIIDFTL